MADESVIQQIAAMLANPNGQQQSYSLPPSNSAWAAPVQPDQTNYDAANTALGMTPQEQALYQRHLSNLYGAGGVDNMNGSRSTLYQMSSDYGGQTYNVPTVYDGTIKSPDEAWTLAQKQGLQNFPSYPNTDAAESRYQQMHGYMDKDTGRFMKLRGGR